MSLKNELDTFYMLFKRHLNEPQKATLRWVTCKEVDWEEGTMNAVDEDNLTYHGIMLGLGSVIVKPVLESDCLIGVIHGHETMTFLISANEAEFIVNNGGENGGLAIVPELQKQLQKQTARIDGIINAINSPSVVATPQDGGTGLLALLRAEIAKITDKEDFSKIEDKTITH